MAEPVDPFFAIEELYDLFGQGSLDRAPAILASATGSRSCTLQITDSQFRPIQIETSYFDEGMGALYVCNAIFEDDPWARVLDDKANTNRSLVLSEHVSEAAYRSSRLFNDFIRIAGDDTGQCLGFGGSTRGGTHFNLGLHRAFSQKSFGDSEKRLLDRLIPHLGRLLDAERRLGQIELKSGLIESAIADLPQPCVILGPDGGVLIANRSADVIFARSDGLTCHNKRLSLKHGDHKALARAIGQALSRTDDHGGSALVLRDDFLNPYRLVVLPLSSRGTTHALVLIDDPDRKSAGRGRHLQSIYKLTAAEAAIALLVADGLSAEDIATLRGVSLATVKTLVNRAYRKADVAKASELAKIVARLPG